VSRWILGPAEPIEEQLSELQLQSSSLLRLLHFCVPESTEFAAVALAEDALVKLSTTILTIPDKPAPSSTAVSKLIEASARVAECHAAAAAPEASATVLRDCSLVMFALGCKHVGSAEAALLCQAHPLEAVRDMVLDWVGRSTARIEKGAECILASMRHAPDVECQGTLAMI